jgi:RNA 2',3'-cyclic 3'-phosphodiesterase
MRLFVAIELDDEARAALQAEQRRIRMALGDSGGPSWMRAERMHVTLAFIGEVDAARLAAIRRAVDMPIDRAAFVMSLEGLGVFPPRGAPRVGWIGATEGTGGIVAVQRTIADRLHDAGVELEARPFHPHVTLVRWRDARPRDAARVRTIAATGEIARVRVDHVTLFESRQSAGGAVYTALASGPLRGRAASPVQ